MKVSCTCSNTLMEYEMETDAYVCPKCKNIIGQECLHTASIVFGQLSHIDGMIYPKLTHDVYIEREVE